MGVESSKDRRAPQHVIITFYRFNIALGWAPACWSGATYDSIRQGSWPLALPPSNRLRFVVPAVAEPHTRIQGRQLSLGREQCQRDCIKPGREHIALFRDSRHPRGTSPKSPATQASTSLFGNCHCEFHTSSTSTSTRESCHPAIEALSWLKTKPNDSPWTPILRHPDS